MNWNTRYAMARGDSARVMLRKLRDNAAKMADRYPQEPGQKHIIQDLWDQYRQNAPAHLLTGLDEGSTPEEEQRLANEHNEGWNSTDLATHTRLADLCIEASKRLDHAAHLGHEEGPQAGAYKLYGTSELYKEINQLHERSISRATGWENLNPGEGEPLESRGRKRDLPIPTEEAS